MAKAVVAQQQGHQYQARFFWIQVCRLFEHRTKVIRVGYEVNQPRGFDDVATFYNPPIPDEFGESVSADYFQIKFHTDFAGAFTWQSLMDPAFVNASSQSLLQRLVAAQAALAPEGKRCRFLIVAPWVIHPDDPLARIVSPQGGELRFDRLFDDKQRSTMGQIRAAWRDHLGLGTDDALAAVLRPLRIKAGYPDLQSVYGQLNAFLTGAGLISVDDGHVVHPYDDLIGRLHAQGRTEFTREAIEHVCRQESLWRGRLAEDEHAVQIGIRSFTRWSDYLEDRTDQLLCLVRHFDGRWIRKPELWQGAVLPEISSFFQETMREPKPYHLYLEAHTSIAFAAGYCVDSKSGVDVTPVQSTQKGKILWQPLDDCLPNNPELWMYAEEPAAPTGNEVALAVSVTHDVLNDVRVYVQSTLPGVRRILSAKINSGPSPRAVRDGTHALELAEHLSTYVKQQRSAAERGGKLHVFLSAPNAFTFFLGKQGRSFGPCILYEYDFDRNVCDGYCPALTFPPPMDRAFDG